MKRAIALAGGGPAAGLHIGVLKGLRDAKVEFDVWALSCIGAWVGVVYNQADKGQEVEQTEAFFRDGVFRDDASYSRFPVNKVFGPDIASNASALMAFLLNPTSYIGLWTSNAIPEALHETLSFLSNPRKWNQGDYNLWMLNGVLATNPLMRFLTSMTHLSNINGLSKIYYRDSSFLKKIRFHKLSEKGKPFIYHNAWNLSSKAPKKEDRLQLFANRPEDLGPGKAKKYRPITEESLCACSALPYVESTVTIDGIEYCEGALIDTVNFKDLVEDHPDVEEVWVSRIVDVDQVRPPRNMVDALSNLCMLFAAEVGANDVKLFKQHLKEDKRKVRVIEIPVSSEINFEWTHSNLDKGIAKGCEAVSAKLQALGMK